MNLLKMISNVVVILADLNGNIKIRYDDGANDGKVIVTNDSDTFWDIVTGEIKKKGGLF